MFRILFSADRYNRHAAVKDNTFMYTGATAVGVLKIAAMVSTVLVGGRWLCGGTRMVRIQISQKGPDQMAQQLAHILQNFAGPGHH